VILPRGITGFLDSGAPIPTRSDFAAFLQLGHAAAQAVGCDVSGGLDRTHVVTPNFHAVTFAQRELVSVLICNTRYPFVAAVEHLSGTCRLEFRVIPETIAGLAEQSGFRVLSKSVLELPPDDQAISALAAAEVEQIQYWRPKRIGDIIYNFWD